MITVLDYNCYDVGSILNCLYLVQFFSSKS